MDNSKYGRALLAATLLGAVGPKIPDDRLHNGVERVRNPWDDVNLTKAERKGKTYAELQALRREKWETARKNR